MNSKTLTKIAGKVKKLSRRVKKHYLQKAKNLEEVKAMRTRTAHLLLNARGDAQQAMRKKRYNKAVVALNQGIKGPEAAKAQKAVNSYKYEEPRRQYVGTTPERELKKDKTRYHQEAKKVLHRNARSLKIRDSMIAGAGVVTVGAGSAAISKRKRKK